MLLVSYKKNISLIRIFFLNIRKFQDEPKKFDNSKFYPFGVVPTIPNPTSLFKYDYSFNDVFIEKSENNYNQDSILFSSLLFSQFFKYDQALVLKFKSRRIIDEMFFIKPSLIFLFLLKFRLSQFLPDSQILDIFAYDAIFIQKITKKFLRQPLTREKAPKTNPLILVYIIHNFKYQRRFYFFTSPLKAQKDTNPTSIENIFKNASWLERETHELSGTCHTWARDIRNLLLPYGFSGTPMRKFVDFPGDREFITDVVRSTVNVESFQGRQF